MTAVELVPLQPSDAALLAKLANNKKIWDNLKDYFPHPYTLLHAQQYIHTKQTDDPTLTFGIQYHSKLVGLISLEPLKDVYRKSAVIGYWIGEPYWGKGIGSKAVALICKYGFTTLNLHRIQTGVFEHNHASMHVLRKNGFVLEGVFRNAAFKNNAFVNEHKFALLKGDWERNNTNSVN